VSELKDMGFISVMLNGRKRALSLTEKGMLIAA
jgi:hypothetical protein